MLELETQHDTVTQELQSTTEKLTTLQSQHTETQEQNQQLAQELQGVKSDLTTLEEKSNNVENALNEEKQALQKVLVTCFHLPQPDTLNLSDWATGVIAQKGTWPWLRQVLSGELFACQQVVDTLKETGNEADQKILKLLEMDDILSDWQTLLSGTEFESDDELWTLVRTLDSGKWLNRVLRANDLLQTYFSERQQLTLLSSHLSGVVAVSSVVVTSC
ncbi:hypothetical protein BGS_0962 [Beggiatoa sp. SS]|nr:hypothetical protein BGS_0962 [Beggiatoa sp. SS]